LDVHLWHSELAGLGQCATNLAFSKAQATQGGEGFRLHLYRPRLRHLSVVAAVGMPESNPGGDGAGDDELAAMCCAMVRRKK
jgi:hypothetical protein